MNRNPPQLAPTTGSLLAADAASEGVRSWQWAVLASVLVLAAAVRLHRLTGGSFWFDEQCSVLVASGHFREWDQLPRNTWLDPAPHVTWGREVGPWSAVWRAPDVHPPLYPLVLRAWRNIAGEGDAAARGLSVLASLAAIVLLFDLGRTLLGTTPALWACAVMAAAEPQIQYAQEARGYALLAALGLGASAAAARLVVRGAGWRRAASLAACLLGMLLTHYFAAGPAIALAAWTVAMSRGAARRQAWAAAATAGVIALAALAPSLVPQAYTRGRGGGWLVYEGAEHAHNTLWRFALLPARFLAEPRDGTEAVASVAAVAYVLPLLLLRRRPAMSWCALWLLSAVGSVAAVDLTRGTSALEYVRYTLVAAPAVYLFIAGVAGRGLAAHFLPATAFAGCLLAVPYAYNTTWKGDWREAGGDIRRLVRAGDAVLFVARPEMSLVSPLNMYAGADYYAGPIPCPVILLEADINPALTARLRRVSHVWVVAPDPSEIAAQLPGWRFREAGPRRLYAGRIFELFPPKVISSP